MAGGVRLLTLAAALGAGTLGGVLFAFSGFVMPALKRLPPAQGVAAMQSINVTATRFPLMFLVFGTGVACLAVLVVAVRRWDEPGSALLLAGALVFLIGGLVVTGAFNVPLNERLAVLDPAAAASDGSWSRFLRGWLPANHVRAAACATASGLLLAAAVRA